PMTPIVVLPLLLIATIFIAYVVYFVTMRIVRATAKRASVTIDARVMWLLEHYLFPLLIVIGLLLVLDAAPLPPKVARVANRLLSLAGLGIALFIITRGTLLLLRNIAARYEPLQNIQTPVELVTKIGLTVIGGMLILDNLGVSLTPLLTTLGIGSLAVAIALQDTLGNVFAGVHIKADRPIAVGQFIRLESGEDGVVERIGWRSTRVRMLPNKTAVVPNSKLVQSTIINYDLPDSELAVLVPVGVHYDSDLKKVEQVTCKVAKEVMQTVPGGIPNFNPFIRYHTFNQSSIDFTVILRAQRFVDGFLVKHEFVKRLQERYQEEGIVIPFPIRTVVLKSDREGEGDGPAREAAGGYEH
ncbi:MAG TPA: mechanosensitive ion channel family protein, partial [Candidatus Binatia bacterium]|nr:mechanosensitive ion channel family protein [Candidatus Binatia bacterium]